MIWLEKAKTFLGALAAKDKEKVLEMCVSGLVFKGESGHVNLSYVLKQMDGDDCHLPRFVIIDTAYNDKTIFIHYFVGRNRRLILIKFDISGKISEVVNC